MSISSRQDGATPGPWFAFNMVHAERGDQMTPEEIGEYVKNNVLKSVADGGSLDRFLFVSSSEEGAPDICHVGNGPRGPYNAALISASPTMLEYIVKRAAAGDVEAAQIMEIIHASR